MSDYLCPYCKQLVAPNHLELSFYCREANRAYAINKIIEFEHEQYKDAQERVWALTKQLSAKDAEIKQLKAALGKVGIFGGDT